MQGLLFGMGVALTVEGSVCDVAEHIFLIYQAGLDLEFLGVNSLLHGGYLMPSFDWSWHMKLGDDVLYKE